MVNSIQRDQRRRFLVSKFELRRVQYKALLQNASLPGFLRKQASSLMKKMPRKSTRTRVRNRCILTARGRGVLRFCKISRISFRELASQGVLNGVIKASW